VYGLGDFPGRIPGRILPLRSIERQQDPTAARRNRARGGKIMKTMMINPVYAVPVMFTLILAGLAVWMEYRPEIQDALRMAQNFIFG
jgi:hypothetical protein